MKTTWIKTCSSPFLLNWSRRALSTKIEEHTSCIYRLARHRGEECLSFTVDKRGGTPITRAICALNLIIQVCCRRAPGGSVHCSKPRADPGDPWARRLTQGSMFNVSTRTPGVVATGRHCRRAPRACDHWSRANTDKQNFFNFACSHNYARRCNGVVHPTSAAIT